MSIFGYFDGPGDVPAYDPPHDALCPHCNLPIHADDVRTPSMMAMPDTGPERSYFYRLHRTCDEAATERQRLNIDALVWKQIEAAGFIDTGKPDPTP